MSSTKTGVSRADNELARARILAKRRRGEPLAQAEIALLFGVTRQAVHIVEKRAMAKLRAYMAARGEAVTQ